MRIKCLMNRVIQIGDHGAFLAMVDIVWREHCEQMNTVRNIFLYLDRYSNYPIVQKYEMECTSVEL